MKILDFGHEALPELSTTHPNRVALAIVDELKLQVSTSERTEIGAAETQNAEAFLAYQNGRDLLGRRLFDQAAIELRRAYQLDTNYTTKKAVELDPAAHHLLRGW